jgi:hypothetical protein
VAGFCGGAGRRAKKRTAMTESDSSLLTEEGYKKGGDGLGWRNGRTALHLHLMDGPARTKWTGRFRPFCQAVFLGGGEGVYQVLPELMS